MPKFQRTLKNQVSCFGKGLHTGLPISITLLPAPADHGIVFVRRDIRDKSNIIPAHYSLVSNTILGTTITNAEGIKIGTIEHLMAAFWGCQIDNAIVEIDGPEVPIMDGSAEPFSFLIECAGTQELAKSKKFIEVLEPISVYEGNASLVLQPADSFKISLEIDFGDQVIAKQARSFNFENYSFKSELARARTFGFAHEVEKLRSLGFAKGGSLDNAIVVGQEGVLNETGLRYKDEFVRHKILDCIGDLYLAGANFKGHFQGVRSGHTLNNKLLHALFAKKSAWKMLEIEDTAQAA